MGMVVRTNTMANNAFRQLGMNNSALSKSLEKLSSGFRINRAADDAAGLAISEKMKAQITGLEAASANAEDGISLVQTAEGALNEVHDMLNRMAELATKASNGTYTEQQRQNYQDELTQLQEEIDRIADSTNFNTLNLLDGNLSAPAGEVVATGATGDAATKTSFTIDIAGITSTSGVTSQDVTIAMTSGETITIAGVTSTSNDAAGVAAGIANVTSATIDGKTYDVTANGTKLTFTSQDEGAPTIDFSTDTVASVTATGIDGTTVTTNTVDAWTAGQDAGTGTSASSKIDLSDLSGASAIGGTITISDGNTTKEYTFVEEGKGSGANGAADTDEIEITADATANDIIEALRTKMGAAGDNVTDFTVTNNNDGTMTVVADAAADDEEITITTQNMGGLVLQVGDSNNGFNKLTVSVQDMHAESLKVDADSINLKDVASAGKAIDNINAAIDTVSGVRSNLGAIQNRLEHTVNNLDTTAENLDAANSRIRDTDMASEMMEYTKMSVLVQSAQAMLAQANQQPQAVLQLLQ